MPDYRTAVGEHGPLEFGVMTPLGAAPVTIDGDSLTMATLTPEPTTIPPLSLRYDRDSDTWLLVFTNPTPRAGLWQSPVATLPPPGVWFFGGVGW